MRKDRVEGIGSVAGGEYESITIDGIGKLKDNASADSLTVNGLFKSKGKLTVKDFTVNGCARIFRDLKAETVIVEGVLKLRRARLYANKISCNGVIICTKEINADNIYIDGACSISKIFGDTIIIKNNVTNVKNFKMPSFKFLLRLYFGRDINLSQSTADIIECTALTASGIKANTIRADSVDLTDGCIIDKLYCKGNMKIDESCQIGQIIDGDNNSKYIKESVVMQGTNIINILNLYKDGKISAQEAEKMLEINKASGKDNKEPSTDWNDDGKLRIVAYIGKKLLKKGSFEYQKLEVKYEGPALNVESYMSLSCNDIGGNAVAGSHINCGIIGGNVTAGSHIQCGDIRGNVTAGSSVTCKNASGDIKAGSGVRIEK